MKISLMALVAGFCLVVGLPLAATGGPPTGPDTDGDGVPDMIDNCNLTPNGEQKDFDHDGCGEPCDCDFNADTVCNPLDFSILTASYLKGEGHPAYNPLTDLDCNGVVNPVDFSLFVSNYLTSVALECP